MSCIYKEGTAVLGLLTMLAGDVIYPSEWRDEIPEEERGTESV